MMLPASAPAHVPLRKDKQRKSISLSCMQTLQIRCFLKTVTFQSGFVAGIEPKSVDWPSTFQ